jgi:hypothetical protein
LALSAARLVGRNSTKSANRAPRDSASRPERARARVQVEHARAGHVVGEQVEQRGPHVLGRGPHAPVARRGEVAAREPPADDAHGRNLAGRTPRGAGRRCSPPVLAAGARRRCSPPVLAAGATARCDPPALVVGAWGRARARGRAGARERGRAARARARP